MEIAGPAEGGRSQEHWNLLGHLKATAEELMSNNDPGSARRFSGVQRLCKDMHNILKHGSSMQHGYWSFVWCVRYICPHLACHVEQFGEPERVMASDAERQSCGGGQQAEAWLLHSIQERCLCAQLKPLLKHQSHTRKYYSDEAFILSKLHVFLMLRCLDAVEQSKPQLLVLVDSLQLSGLRGAAFSRLKIQSLCLFPGQPQISSDDVLPESNSIAVPQIWLTEPHTPMQYLGDPADGTVTDGLQYLSVCKQRRASYSEGQSRPEESNKGHGRSLSDTSIAQKHDSEESSVENYGLFSSQDNKVRTCSRSVNSDCSQDSWGPQERRSLLSVLRNQDFGSCADLEKENAHFSISDSLIAAIELLKWRLRDREDDEGDEDEDCDSEIQQLMEVLWHSGPQLHYRRIHLGSSGSARSSQESLRLFDLSSAEEDDPSDVSDSDVKPSMNQFSSYSSLSSEYRSSPLQGNSQGNSAQSVALGLLRQLEGLLPAAAELNWLLCEQDASQKVGGAHTLCTKLSLLSGQGVQ
ncbi:hypothetical protein GJAV_G00089230 [Gymnothorax javanicus]|nr:hypothetical protein GJAV_G00089230 [Gymnothorax javanicus]